MLPDESRSAPAMDPPSRRIPALTSVQGPFMRRRLSAAPMSLGRTVLRLAPGEQARRAVSDIAVASTADFRISIIPAGSRRRSATAGASPISRHVDNAAGKEQQVQGAVVSAKCENIME